MKKIFGILSLIAIFTVAFTSQASANDIGDNQIVYDIGYDTPSVVSVGVEVGIVEVGVFNVTDETVNYTSVGGLYEDANIVTGDSSINSKFGTSFATIHLPNEVGLSNVPNLNEYVNKYNNTFGYEAPVIIERISTNVGKLTKIPIHS